MNLERNKQIMQVGLGRYISLSESLVANRKIDENEWNLLNKMPRISYSGFNTETSVELVIHMSNKLQAMYNLLGRDNIPIADKRRFLILMAERI